MINLRNGRLDDIPRLLQLLEILTGIEESFDFDREAHTRGLSLLIEAQPRTCVAVAEESGKVIGMCTGQTVISTAMGGPSVWVEDVVVHPDYRRLGLGAQLMDYLSDWAASCGALRQQLLIDNDNGSALEFYRTQNWKRTNFSCLRKLRLE